MTVVEAIENVKKEGHYTDENLKELKAAALDANFKDFQDPDFKVLINLFNDFPYDERVQKIIYALAEDFSRRGIVSPCASGCSDECVLHEAEMNGKI